MICDPVVALEAPAEELRFVSTSRPQGGRSPGERRIGPFGRPAFAFIVLALPALWVGWLVYRYGVDTPWGDEWDSTRLLVEKMQAGTLGLADFSAFHNEHRIFFPRLLTFALAKLTHWNVRAELLMIWILACVCSLNLWRVAQVTGWRNSRMRHWLLLGTNVLLFSPLQWENLLWGFQIGFFLPLATTTACLWVAPSLRRPFDFLATVFLCLISTFSIASGFASWFLTAPLLLLWNGKTRARGEKTWWLGWLFIGVASICFCFRGYARPATHPSVLEALNHPFRAIQFALAYLGTPFFGTAPNASAVASVASAALVLLFAACLHYLWRWRRDRTLLAHSLPWVSLASWALVNAFLTMLGRLGFGIFAATLPRYVSFAIMLPIGLLFLASLVFRHWREQSDIGMSAVRTGRGVFVLVTALSLLVICGTIKSLESWSRFQHSRLTGKALLLLVNIVDEPQALVRYVHWDSPSLKGWTNTLDRLGYLRPALVQSRHVREIAYGSMPGTMGEFEEISRNPGGEFVASGWAILPESHRTADGVLLTYDDSQGDPIIFALAEVKYKRADVSQRLDDKAYFRSGWVKPLEAGQIPANSRWIRAWAFNAEKCRAFQIGAASLESPKAVP
ncbi:MAG TPA: hypothetical protein VF345_07740 [Chthoniobacterales bacterium]